MKINKIHNTGSVCEDHNIEAMTSVIFERHLEQGELIITDNILQSSNMIENIHCNLIYLDSRKDINTIKIFIDSFGGYMRASVTAAELIMSLNKPVWTYALGHVWSASIVLFASGDKRFAFPSSSFMLHDISIGGSEDTRLFYTRFALLNDDLINKCTELLALKTRTSKKQWDEYYKSSGQFFSTEDALDMGLVTDIIYPSKKKIDKHARNKKYNK